MDISDHLRQTYSPRQTPIKSVSYWIPSPRPDQTNNTIQMIKIRREAKTFSEARGWTQFDQGIIMRCTGNPTLL